MEEQAGKWLFEVDLGANGGRLAPRTLSQFARAMERERDKWKWLDAVSDEVPEALWNHVSHVLDNLASYAEAARAEGSVDGEDAANRLEGAYGGEYPAVYHSEGDFGRAILSMREDCGDDMAALAYGILSGQIAPNLRSTRHFRALFLISNPSQINAEARRLAADKDYRSWQEESRDLLSEQSALVEQARATASDLERRAMDEGRAAYRRFVRSGVKARRALRIKGDRAISDIDNTRAAYQDQMRLKASVAYWGDKKAMHYDARRAAVRQLVWLAVLGGTGATLIFVAAMIFMLEASGIDATGWFDLTPPAGRSIALSAYVVVTGAVGTVLTALFWAARILVRNYMTERRLEGDAEERRTMTQTYLALVDQGAASEDERLIILNALFRPSPDQPTGGEEAGSDVALPAILAKLMDQRALR